VHCGFFTARDHKVVERDIEGVKIRAFFPADGEQTAKACLETAVDVVRFYKKWLGFYPHPSLDILPGAPAPWGGYLFATAQSVIHGMPAFDTKPIEHWRWITAHEIGHQYWGAHVLDGDDPQWLWIGLGIYADFRWREHAKTDGAAPFFSTYLEGVKAGHDTTLDLPPQQARRLKFDRNNVVVHGKGWAVISALEAVMGRKTFEIAYRACLREFAHRPMGWRDFQKVCESACGQDLRWFFEEWVRTKNYAAYRIASQECVARGKGFHAVINVEKVGQIGLPLPVKALFEDGSSQIRVLDRMAKTDRWELESQAPLKEVKLDPEGRFAFLPEALPPTRDEIEVRLDSLPWKQAGIEAVEVFEAARRVRIDDAGSWFKLGLVLFEGGRFTESLQAFETVEGCKPDPGRRFGSLVWRGHLNDLKGRRDEALALYRQALAMEGDHAMQHSQLSITIDRAWVERRLKEPFRVDRSK
jgi:tetratricopeptide (TPR) repeat protein